MVSMWRRIGQRGSARSIERPGVWNWRGAGFGRGSGVVLELLGRMELRRAYRVFNAGTHSRRGTGVQHGTERESRRRVK